MRSVVRDWRNAPLDAVDRSLCEFAVKLTFNNSGMTQHDLEHLRDMGLDDRAVHDAVQVVAYFNYITRIADAFGLEPASAGYPRHEKK